MRTLNRPLRLATLLALSLSLGALSVHADTLAMPSQSANAGAAASTPARGATMSKVEAKFGAPTQRHSAVGQPPITRWDYTNFSVFFEYDHVVHTVVH